MTVEARRAAISSAASSGDPQELACRRECIGIEAERRTGHSLSPMRSFEGVVVVLAATVAPATEVIDDGDTERAAFNRFRPIDLADKDERRRLETAIHSGKVGDVPRERIRLASIDCHR
jgi:hypothetical protein